MGYEYPDVDVLMNRAHGLGLGQTRYEFAAPGLQGLRATGLRDRSTSFSRHCLGHHIDVGVKGMGGTRQSNSDIIHYKSSSYTTQTLSPVLVQWCSG